MIREHIKGVIELDEMLNELQKDPEFYYVQYMKTVRGFDVKGRLKEMKRTYSNHEYIYREQDTLGDKYRGFLYLPLGYEYYAQFRFIV